MKAKERAAISRILIDLIKADKVIDSREINLYRNLKEQFSITQQDEIEAYTIPLNEAVHILKQMDSSTISHLLGIFEDMTASDGFCAREEALLMLMLHYCLRQDNLDCDVISTIIEDSLFDERQVLYVESRHVKEVNFAITSNLRAISHELGLCGFSFVYIPKIAHHYITIPKELLYEVVAMLSPSLTESAKKELLTKIKLLKTDTFCVEQLHHKLGFEELADTPPSLMFKISKSKVGSNIYTNFLLIELTADAIAIVQDIVDTFMFYNSSDEIVVSCKKDEKGSLLYNGFYRQVFEILLLQQAVRCHLLIDFVHGTLSFPEIDVNLSSLHRKEKALYTLFVYETQNGGICFMPPQSKKQLPNFDRRMKTIQRRYAKIYTAFGGEKDNAPDITRADIRLPMISGIRRAINKQKEKIYDADRFAINRDKNGIYGISAIPEAFLSKDFSNECAISIFDSTLFVELSKFG